MTYSTPTQSIERMNRLGASKTPFVFLVDYKIQQPLVLTWDEAHQAGIFFDINGQNNHQDHCFDLLPADFHFKSQPISFEEYLPKFNLIQKGLKRGDSFLTNLTQATNINTNLSLSAIYARSRTKYKILFGDEFVCFSPEIFVQIADGRIATHPMKGTIEAHLPDAESQILNSPKEKAEHTTIVDLLRNDLSQICHKVWVERFRYISRVHTHRGELLQVSSEICGLLPNDYLQNLGTLLFKLLPAGSICGAPKPQTIALIEAAEGYQRGYYTGVCGIFDGQKLDSGVMIRFIENTSTGKVFKSGGGITAQSDAQVEYAEMVRKVYLPFL
jgi:para-aminobenzoate synthetase component I